MEWFYELTGSESGIETFYWVLALVGTVFFGLKILFNSIFDFDHELDWDLDLDDIGLGHWDFSLGPILAFLTSWGWIGVFLLHNVSSPWLVHFSAFAGGVIALLLSAWLFGKMKRWETSGTLNLRNAIGKVGRVYLSIPPEGKGKGQIQLDIQGRLYTMNAITDAKEALPTGSQVLVYDVNKGTLVVSPYEEEAIEETL